MKKFIHIIIAIIWLFASSGFSITKHYCGGRYVKTSINSTPKACCQNPKCCHNESKVYQLDEQADLQVSSANLDISILDLSFFENEYFALNTTENNNSVHLDYIIIPPRERPAQRASLQSFLL